MRRQKTGAAAAADEEEQQGKLHTSPAIIVVVIVVVVVAAVVVVPVVVVPVVVTIVAAVPAAAISIATPPREPAQFHGHQVKKLHTSLECLPLIRFFRCIQNTSNELDCRARSKTSQIFFQCRQEEDAAESSD